MNTPKTKTVSLTRRAFLKWVAAGTVLATAGVVSATRDEAARTELTQVEIPLKDLPPSLDGLRLAQISDIHMGGWMNLARFRHSMDLIKENQPDLIVITGDLISRSSDLSRALEDLFTGLRKLSQITPVFAVLGNHDHWRGSANVREALTLSGVMELPNQSAAYEKNGGKLHLCGLDDVMLGHNRMDQALRDIPEGAPAIALVHEPDYADWTAKTGRIGLQLSGHSHGGQIVLPGLGALILPYLAEKYPSGLYMVNQMNLYTNRGLGMASLPIRLNCPPEITLISLRA